MIINNWYYILQLDTDTDLQFIHMVKMASDGLKRVQIDMWGRWTHKQLETHGCVLSTVAADALLLKYRQIEFIGSPFGTGVAILCTGPVSYMNITVVGNRIRKWNHI